MLMQTFGVELVGNQRTLPRTKLLQQLKKHQGRAAFRGEEERRQRLVVELRTHPGSVPTVKQHLAAIRILGDLARRQPGPPREPRYRPCGGAFGQHCGGGLTGCPLIPTQAAPAAAVGPRLEACGQQVRVRPERLRPAMVTTCRSPPAAVRRGRGPVRGSPQEPLVVFPGWVPV